MQRIGTCAALWMAACHHPTTGGPSDGTTAADAAVAPDAGDGGIPVVTGLNWPANQSFPSFAPIAPLDVVDVDGRPADQVRMLVSLQGLINRTQPRIYLESGEAEGKTFWLDHLSVSKTIVSDPLSLVTKYASEIDGMEITDDAQVDTNNLATALAGVDNAIVVSPALATQLSAAPYQLATKTDLRTQHFASKLAVYQWELDHVAPMATNRLIVGLDPAAVLGPRDLAVAAKATTVWLNPNDTNELTLLNKFLARLAPNSPYVGWWTGEQAGVSAASKYGVPTFAADLFRNMSVLAGTPRTIHVPPAPLPPPLQNKIYVALFASDGDNMQEDEHLITRKWNTDTNRGKVPIGWTISPGLVDAAPIILDYFWSTASANDVMVAGASGLGYTYPTQWPAAAVDQYTERTSSYLTAGGLRAITVWTYGPGSGPDLAGAVATSYASHLPRLLGVTMQAQTQDYQQLGNSLPAFKFLSSNGINYGYVGDAATIETGINGAVAGWAGNAPLFLAVQGNMNLATISPTAFYNVQQNYAGNPNVVFVRADHFFQLLREAHGLPVEPGRDARGPLGDFDGDHRADYAVRSITDGTIRVRLNPTSGFATTTAFTAPSTSGDPLSNFTTVIGDFDGDGKADYADHARSDGHLLVHLNTGNGFSTASFEEAFTAHGPNWQLLIGDFDGDGKADYVDHGLPDGRFDVHLNTGTGFSPTVSEEAFTAYGADVETLIGDFNGDGKADYADHTLSTGQLAVHLNTGTGFAPDVFEVGTTVPAGMSETLIGDFDGDGKADFADRDLITGVLVVHLNTGTGFSTDTYEMTATEIGPNVEVLGSSR
jgi:hypothetical protein